MEFTKNRKRNHSRSFNQKVKRFRGCVENEDVQYLVRIWDVAQKDNLDPSEKEMLAENFLAETKDKEKEVLLSSVGSKIFERILPWATVESFTRITELLSKDFRTYFLDKYASRVLESAVKTTSNRDCPDLFLIKVAKFAINNLIDFLWDRVATYPVRSIVVAIHVGAPDCPKLLHLQDLLLERLLQSHQITSLANSDIGSGFLQVLLTHLSSPQQLLESLQSIFLEAKDLQENVPLLCLLEVAMEVDQDKFTQAIWKSHFKGCASSWGFHPRGNKSLQKLLGFAKSDVALDLWEDLNEHLGGLIAVEHFGVVVSLAKAFERLSVKQNQFIDGIFDALGSPGRIFTLTLGDDERKINLQGSLIVQSLLNFKRPGKVVEVILAMSAGDLVEIFSTPYGSRVFDEFMKSTSVGEKSREKLFRQLQGHWPDLITSKHGSRSFDSLWNLSGIERRTKIARELLPSQSKLSSSVFGRFAVSKMRLDEFRRRPKDWEKSQRNSSKKKPEELFRDIIGGK